MLQRLIIFHWDYTNNKQATAPGRIYYYQMTLTDLGVLGLIIMNTFYKTINHPEHRYDSFSYPLLFCYINQRIKLKSIASFKSKDHNEYFLKYGAHQSSGLGKDS